MEQNIFNPQYVIPILFILAVIIAFICDTIYIGRYGKFLAKKCDNVRVGQVYKVTKWNKNPFLISATILIVLEIKSGYCVVKDKHHNLNTISLKYLIKNGILIN